MTPQGKEDGSRHNPNNALCQLQYQFLVLIQLGLDSVVLTVRISC